MLKAMIGANAQLPVRMAGWGARTTAPAMRHTHLGGTSVRARAFNLAARGPISLWQLAPRALQPKRLRRSMCTVEAKATGAPQKTKEEVAAELAERKKYLATVPLPTSDESDEMLRIRHTTAHVMAMAVQSIFKEAKCTIGPWIEKGFYYDFAFENAFSDKDLKKIKKQMDKIIRKDLPLTKEEVTRDEAEKRITAQNEPYKLEILAGLQEPITIYHIGDEWWDLCAGPHVESTGQLDMKAIQLESVAGAYWRGDETKDMLQRIYGTAWAKPEQLEAYNFQKEEAARRDHRKIGQDLQLFSIKDTTGGGLVYWHPKGAMCRHIIETYWKDLHLNRGYELLYSPHVAKLDLWKTSGHFDFYNENMFQAMQVEDEEYQLKPMNCPFHIEVYRGNMFSYRDLPIRWAELGTVYRYERSGTMHGLFRVRGFTQDDAHIFCLPNQIAQEILGVLNLTEELLSNFGFTDYEIMLSTRPDKAVGSDEIWDDATKALREALDLKGWDYGIDEGGGAFYGPKIDLKIKDAIGRSWQCSTIQVDFNLPERFELSYNDSDQQKRRPIMIHRAIFGSLERFFGVLTENYAGDFPLWLAPVQMRIIPVSTAFEEYAHEQAAKLKAAGLRVEVAAGQRLGKAIRNAELEKIPLMAVIGDAEMQADSMTVRARGKGDLGVLPTAEVLSMMTTLVATKATHL